MAAGRGIWWQRPGVSWPGFRGSVSRATVLVASGTKKLRGFPFNCGGRGAPTRPALLLAAVGGAETEPAANGLHSASGFSGAGGRACPAMAAPSLVSPR